MTTTLFAHFQNMIIDQVFFLVLFHVTVYVFFSTPYLILDCRKPWHHYLLLLTYYKARFFDLSILFIQYCLIKWIVSMRPKSTSIWMFEFVPLCLAPLFTTYKLQLQQIINIINYFYNKSLGISYYIAPIFKHWWGWFIRAFDVP